MSLRYVVLLCFIPFVAFSGKKEEPIPTVSKIILCAPKKVIKDGVESYEVDTLKVTQTDLSHKVPQLLEFLGGSGIRLKNNCLEGFETLIKNTEEISWGLFLPSHCLNQERSIKFLKKLLVNAGYGEGSMEYASFVNYGAHSTVLPMSTYKFFASDPSIQGHCPITPVLYITINSINVLDHSDEEGKKKKHIKKSEGRRSIRRVEGKF